MGEKDETCDGGCDTDLWHWCAFEWCDTACCADCYGDFMFKCFWCGDTHCYDHGDEERQLVQGGTWETVWVCDDCQD